MHFTIGRDASPAGRFKTRGVIPFKLACYPNNNDNFQNAYNWNSTCFTQMRTTTHKNDKVVFHTQGILRK